MTRLHAALLATLALGAPTVAQAADDPDRPDASPLRQRLDRAIDRALAEERVVGAVIVVAKDGRVVYRRGAGLIDREAGRPMPAEAIFRLASVTKPIVTLAALRLADQGKLRLDDPVTRWLPDFRPALPDGRPRPSPSRI